MKYVIIGNGIASIGAIEGIRKVDTDNEILVIGAEDSPAYGRPLISYLLAGKITPDRLALRPAEFYEKSKVSPETRDPRFRPSTPRPGPSSRTRARPSNTRTCSSLRAASRSRRPSPVPTGRTCTTSPT